MSEQHTPGPWKFGHLGTEVLWIGPDYNETPVAHVDHDMEYARDNSRENAAYIVHACNLYPELLEALEAVVASSPIEDSVLPKVLDAISKARGEA